jgi:hypothetical protein
MTARSPLYAHSDDTPHPLLPRPLGIRKALISDISQNHGLEYSAVILQVAPKTPLPAGGRMGVTPREEEARVPLALEGPFFIEWQSAG